MANLASEGVICFGGRDSGGCMKEEIMKKKKNIYELKDKAFRQVLLNSEYWRLLSCKHSLFEIIFLAF